MSRSDNFIGLNEKANNFLWKNGKIGKLRLCDDNGNMIREEDKLLYTESDRYTWFSMFGGEYPLRVFELKDGNKVYEKVQLDPWAGGPCIFTALVDEDGKWIEETLWDEDKVLKEL